MPQYTEVRQRFKQFVLRTITCAGCGGKYEVLVTPRLPYRETWMPECECWRTGPVTPW